MKAVDFIKKFGWDWAKELTIKHENCYMPKTFNYWSNKLQDFVLCTKYASFEMSELKQYVDAYELVRSYGGLKCCHEILHKLHELTENPEPIREAIALVEEVENENQD